MNFRRQNAEDYNMIRGWLISRGFPLMPREAMPSLGFCVEDNGTLFSACWIFRDIEGKACWLVFPCTNPAIKPRQAYEAVKHLLEQAEDDLSKTGYSLLFASAKKHGLGKLYSRCGWMAGDTNTTQYLKNIRRF